MSRILGGSERCLDDVDEEEGRAGEEVCERSREQAATQTRRGASSASLGSAATTGTENHRATETSLAMHQGEVGSPRWPRAPGW